MLSYLPSFITKRLKILDRYLLEQIAGPFFLAVGGFAIIAVADIMFYLVELVVISGVPVYTFVRLLLYKLPALMIMFFPMSVLFAVMLVFVRMAKDNELTILRTSGIHSARIIIPVVLFTIFASFLSFLTNEKIVPWTNQESDRLIREDIQRKPPPNIIENVVFKDDAGRYFYVQKVDAKTSDMEHVLIFEETQQFPRIITAKKAKWNAQSWTLEDGFIQETNEDGEVDFLDYFDVMKINVLQSLNAFYQKTKSAKEMDSAELKEKINKLDEGGVSTRSLRVEYHMKRTLPAACFIFGLVGIAYCFSFVRSGKDWWGVIIAICIAVLTVGFYFLLTAYFRATGKSGSIPPHISTWIPNLIYGGIATAIITYQCKNR